MYDKKKLRQIKSACAECGATVRLLFKEKGSLVQCIELPKQQVFRSQNRLSGWVKRQIIDNIQMDISVESVGEQ